jgi:hypothetical protein
MLDPLRDMGKELADLIERKFYFVIHAARQSGKTTLLWKLADKINAEGKYYALYCSLEGLQTFTEPENGIPEIVQKIESCVRKQGLPKGFAKEANYNSISNVLNDCLVEYCRSLDKPFVIFFDEADCLSNDTLITFLRQLREGFVSRARIPFVHTIALVGMRNIRDYKAHVRPESATLGSSSPFNIVSESLTLRNFKYEEVAALYSQHTELTGQVFEHDAVEFVFEQTQGQPWLVNAVARECVEKICKLDYSIAITKEMARIAINNLILQRGTHFDSLMERLKEERVKRIIEPLLIGKNDIEIDRTADDFLYTRDLGLIRLEEKTRRIIPANQIYAETMARALNLNTQESLMKYEKYEIPNYMKDGKIDMKILLSDFQAFWRENSEIWERVYEYKEAAPHLILMAFLQRVINGGGLIQREFALGNQRVDLCIVYKGGKYPIELKIDRGEDYIKKGYSQLLEYMDKCGVSEGSIIIFDKRAGKSWDERIFIKEEQLEDKKVTVFGC